MTAIKLYVDEDASEHAVVQRCEGMVLTYLQPPMQGASKIMMKGSWLLLPRLEGCFTH